MTLVLGATMAVMQQSPAALLDQAIERSGGRQALSAHARLAWRGAATIHIPGRTIEIAGEWDVRPDSAVATTWLRDQPNAPRRLILSGLGGWTQRGDAPPAPMPPELLMEERHQFYLYQVLRLVPLLDPAFTLHPAPPDSLGRPAFRVSHDGHLDVTLYFDRSHRVAALHTVFASADSNPPESQEIELTGSMDSGRVHWFREMRIRRAGRPYFDLTLTEFQAAPGR